MTSWTSALDDVCMPTGRITPWMRDRHNHEIVEHQKNWQLKSAFTLCGDSLKSGSQDSDGVSAHVSGIGNLCGSLKVISGHEKIWMLGNKIQSSPIPCSNKNNS